MPVCWDVTALFVCTDVAVLTSDDMHVVRLPLALLPANMGVGSILDMTMRRNTEAERMQDASIAAVQDHLIAKLEGSSAACG